MCFEKRVAIVEQFKNNKNEHGPKDVKDHLKKLGFLSMDMDVWYVILMQKGSAKGRDP